MSSLYDLSQELSELLDDEELTEEEIDLKMKAVCVNLKDKAENIAKFIKSINAYKKGLKDEMENFVKRVKIADNKIDRIKEYAKIAMETMEIKELGNLHKLKIQKNGGKTPLVYGFNIETPEPYIPKDYLIYSPSIDTEAIRSALDEGKEFEYVEYGERGTHLRVK